ncbi:MAG: endopeptidase Rz [Enterobacter phage ENC18]|nr:MAG: endopeptidase Rz [Enterobacter phage ENC18]
MLKLLRSALPWVLAGTLFMGGWHLGSTHERVNWKEVIQNEYIERTAATEATQVEVNRVSREYQEEIAAIEGSTDRMLNDLRSNNKRLSVRIKTLTGLPEDNGRCKFNGRAELHESDAKRIIGITKAADAHVRALQRTIKEMQNERHPSKP